MRQVERGYPVMLVVPVVLLPLVEGVAQSVSSSRDCRMEQAKHRCLREVGIEPFQPPQPPNDLSDDEIRSVFPAMPVLSAPRG